MNPDVEARQAAAHRQHLLTRQLYKEFDEICFHYRIRLNKPVIRIEAMERYWGTWDSATRCITLSGELIRTYSWEEVTGILKHEMAHMIAEELLGSPRGLHDETFRRACAMIGADSRASAAAADLKKPLHRWQDDQPSDQEARLLRKAEKLLNLATSTNEHEALLAMEKVHALYRRYNLDKARQAASGEYVVLIINHKKKKIPQHQSMMASILTSWFFVEVVFSTQFDAGDMTEYKTMELVGRRENVSMAEYVYFFLLGRLESLWQEQRRRQPRSGARRRAFYLGVLHGFSEKLEQGAGEEAEAAEPPPAAGRSLPAVINDRGLEVYLRQRHPRLWSRSWNSGLRDPRGFREGRQEGRRLTLNKGISRQGEARRPLLKGGQ